MNIKLYRVNINTREKDLKPINLDIEGKLISYFELPDYSNLDYPSDGSFEERFYNYEYDNNYKKRFKKLKLNHRFMINETDEFDDSNLSNLVGYVHLNKIKKVKLDWQFKRTWIQNNENFKWLVGIIVAFISGYIIAKWI